MKIRYFLLSVALPLAMFGQVVQNENFESFTVGPGQLAPPLNIFTFGSAYVSGDPAGDPLSGVVGSSVLGTGKAGYLGGAGTNLTLSAAGGTFGAEVYTGPSSGTPVQLIGSATPFVTGDWDFAVQFNGGTNQESFNFFVFDAQHAASGGFDSHSEVTVSSGGSVLIQDNSQSPFLNTGVSVANDTPYHLQVTVNYNTATWSARLTNKNTLQSYDLATNRPINVSGYTLSGWTTPSNGWFDVFLYADSVSATNASFLDRIVFDNFKVALSPAPQVVQSETFESFAVGPGLLAPPLNIFVFGSAYVSGNPAGDPLSGVVNSSVLGTGKAGYLGGAGTNLTLSATSGDFGAEIFSGPNPATPVQLIGSAAAIVTADFDFAVQFNGGTNQESFNFFVFDAQHAAPGGFDSHSEVTVSTGGSVLIQDNTRSPFLNPGVSVAGNTPYHLRLTVDYNAATWSARLTNKNTLQSYDLATNRPINVNGYTLSGWTTPSDGWFDVFLYADPVSATNASLLDRIIFDNFQVTRTATPDTTPPVLTLPADISVTATSLAGAVVTYAASALDNIDGPVPVSYSIAPGSTFPIGATTVTVSAVDSSGNAGSGSFHVTVVAPTGPPTITLQPQDTSVVAGGTAVLSVSVQGAFPLSYQWRTGGVDIPGATSATLSIVNAQADDAGNYKVVVSNPVGSVTSTPSHLTVLHPVVITLQPASDIVVAGKSEMFKVQATGTHPLSYQWRKDGVPIVGATDNKLSLAAVQNADAGNYDVIVSNVAGAVTSAAASLTVLDKAVITSDPSDLTVTAGQPATLTVVATGTGPLSYQWRMGGVDIPGATAVTLSIANAQAGDAGNYKVVVSNAAGSTTSAAAHLTVLQPVVITLQPASVTVTAGKNTTLKVQASGTGPLTYQWRKNVLPIAGATDNKLTLTGVQGSDAGNYDVVVTNAAGSVTSAVAVLSVH